MKRFLALLVMAAVMVLAAAPAYAARPEIKYPVTFNGHPVLFDTQPENKDGRVYVPFRAIFEKMGAKVFWDGDTKTITATRDNTTINLSIGNATAYVNGAAKDLPGAPYIKDDYTMVPLRFVSEAFGADVTYDDATSAIKIVDANWPRRGGTLNLAMWNKPEGNFHPEVYNDTYGGYIVGNVFDGLWRFDNHLSPVPALAESWEWDSTGTKLTFYLRKDVKFQNGDPFTANDVLVSFKGIMHPKYVGPRNYGWDSLLGYSDYNKGIKGETADDFANGTVTATPIEGLYAPDPYTVVFQLSQPDSTFFLNQTGYGIIDGNQYSKVPVQDWGTANDPYNVHPNGTGAFKLQEYADGQYFVLTANDNYWSGRPYVDKIVWRILSTDVAVGEFQLNKLDFAEAASDTLPSYYKMNNVKVTEFPDLVYQEMMFNWSQGLTADKNIRHAIAYGIDRNSIIHNLLKDHGGTMYTPFHPLTWAATDDVQQYNYNPDKAGQILDADGWTMGNDGYRYKNGQKLELRLYYPNVGNPVRQATAPVFQQMMKDIGIQIDLQGYDWPTLTTKAFEDHDFDMFFIGWSIGPDPDPSGMWDAASIPNGGNNPGGFTTPESEQLIKEGKTTGDIEQRTEIYNKWARLWADELPAYIFYAVNTNLVYNKRLQNFDPGPWGYLWNQEELWLSE